MEVYREQEHQRYLKDANLLIWAKKNIENQKSLNTELKELGVNSELFNGDNIITHIDPNDQNQGENITIEEVLSSDTYNPENPKHAVLDYTKSWSEQ